MFLISQLGKNPDFYPLLLGIDHEKVFVVCLHHCHVRPAASQVSACSCTSATVRDILTLEGTSLRFLLCVR